MLCTLPIVYSSDTKPLAVFGDSVYMSKQLSDDLEAVNIKLFACKRKSKGNELSESDKLILLAT